MTTQLLDYTIPAGEDMSLFGVQSQYIISRGWLFSNSLGWHYRDVNGCAYYRSRLSDAYQLQKEWEADADMVNHPPHYNKGKYETIDIIEDADLGYHLSAALKYLLRCPYKNDMDQDLAKAVWYIERYRKLLKAKGS